MLWGALSSGSWRRGFGDDGQGQFPACPGDGKRRPGVAFPLTPPVQPFEHEAFDFVCVAREALRVPYHSVVVPVALQPAPQCGDGGREREAADRRNISKVKGRDKSYR